MKNHYKLITLLAVSLLLFSCKKSEISSSQVKTYSFKELKTLALSDTNINKLFIASQKIATIKSYRTSFLLSTIKDDKKVAAILSLNTDTSYFKNIKNENDLAIALNRAGVNNSDLIAKQIEIQINCLQSFVKQYPEIKNLSREQLKELFTAAAKGKIVLNSSAKISLPSNIKLASCAFDFNNSVQGCEDDYNVTMLGVWAAAVDALVETGGWSIGGGLIGSGVAYVIWDNCMVRAGNGYGDCSGY